MFRLTRFFLVLLKSNAHIAIQYRVTLIMGIISSLLWMLLSVLSISILTYQTPEIGGWNRYELFVVQGVYSVVLGMIYFVFRENIKIISRLIRLGKIDQLFLKPIDSQLLASVGKFNFYQLGRIIGGIILLWISLHMLAITITISKVLLFILLALSGSLIVYSLWFMLITLSFWFTDLFNLDELLIHITGTARYPLEVLKYLSQYLFYVMLPLIAVTTVPAQVLINKLNITLAGASFLISGGLFIFARKFWQYALKFYTSAGG